VLPAAATNDENPHARRLCPAMSIEGLDQQCWAHNGQVNRTGAARLVAVVLAVVAAVTAGVGVSASRTHAGVPTRSAANAAARQHGIHRTRIIVTDRTRPTVSHGHVLAHYRRLPTLLWRPVAAGQYPLVVFCHGYDSTPLPYRHLLKHWAAKGFVVAAPYFPLTRAGAGKWLDESDVDNQPGDVSAVITAVERRFASWVDPRHVIVAGHSDGGSTALGVGFADRLRDPRVSAVMVFAGARRPTMGRFSHRRLPMLLAQSDADESNSLRSAARVWAVPRRPKVYLHLHGAQHLPPFASRCRWRPIVEAVTSDFLREWTTTQPAVRRTERHAIDRQGTRTGLSWVTDDS